MRYVILLTACVDPQGMIRTTLQNVDERKQQYKNALKYYLDNYDIPIVFVENSNTDFSEEFESYIKSGRLEYLFFEGNNFDKTKGKGFGEAEIISRAMKDSKFINDSDYIIKITGRLIINNLSKIIKYVEKNRTDKFVFAGIIRHNQKIAESVCLVTTIPFMRGYFLPISDQINDNEKIYFEHILYRALIDKMRKGYLYLHFNQPLDIVGISGSSGNPYLKISAKRRIIYYLKSILHNFFIRRLYKISKI